MSHYFKIAFAATCLFLYSCGFKKDPLFTIEIEHLGFMDGGSVIQTITDESLTIRSKCSSEPCLSQPRYHQRLSKQEGLELYRYIQSLRFDTLQSKRHPSGGINELFATIIIVEGTELPSISETFDNSRMPELQGLYEQVETLIQDPKYRLASWGYE